MERPTYTVEEVCAMLSEHLGSGPDPVIVGGIETTPDDLRYSELADRDSRDLRLHYYPVQGGPLRLRGTLFGMLKDRLGIWRGLRR